MTCNRQKNQRCVEVECGCRCSCNDNAVAKYFGCLICIRPLDGGGCENPSGRPQIDEHPENIETFVFPFRLSMVPKVVASTLINLFCLSILLPVLPDRYCLIRIVKDLVHVRMSLKNTQELFLRDCRGVVVLASYFLNQQFNCHLQKFWLHFEPLALQHLPKECNELFLVQRPRSVQIQRVKHLECSFFATAFLYLGCQL
mmetsp:Transcript_5864/g.10892  ORF Transcript_5864/g.10892 Transcript_5864/m.10892 type:complete len:200 (+) Transcript_5864:1547-2146(+)